MWHFVKTSDRSEYNFQCFTSNSRQFTADFHTHDVKILTLSFFFQSFICSCSFVVDANLLFTVISKQRKTCDCCRLIVVFYSLTYWGGGGERRFSFCWENVGLCQENHLYPEQIKILVKKWCKDDLSEAEAQVPSEGSTLIEFLWETRALALPGSCYQDLGWGLKEVPIGCYWDCIGQQSVKYFSLYFIWKNEIIAFCSINLTQQTHCLNKKRGSELS